MLMDGGTRNFLRSELCTPNMSLRPVRPVNREGRGVNPPYKKLAPWKIVLDIV